MNNAQFLNQIKDWINLNGEIFVVIRYSHSAGARYYIIVNSFDEFRDLVAKLPTKANVIVFRQKQLPIRGQANNTLREQALDEIQDAEYLLTSRGSYNPRALTSAEGVGQQEFIVDFEDFRGKSVAIGKMPFWNQADNENMVSALVPLPDGSIEVGVY